MKWQRCHSISTRCHRGFVHCHPNVARVNTPLPLRIQVRIGSQGSKFFRKLRGGKIYCTEMLTYSWFPLVRKVKCPAFLTDKNDDDSGCERVLIFESIRYKIKSKLLQ